MWKNIFFSITILLIFFSCKKKETNTQEKYTELPQVTWRDAQKYYLKNISKASVLLDSLDKISVDDPKIKELFFGIRKAFKKAEPYAGVLNAEITHRANGPALPIYKEDSNNFMEPIGLQKLEETIFSDTINVKQLKRDVYFLRGLFNNLKGYIEKKEINPSRYFVATHQQLMRIISFSTVGFDTPISGHSINESKFLLQSFFDVYDISIRPLIQHKNNDLDAVFKKNIEKAIAFVGENPDFEKFDRYTFIKDYLNPITRNWVEIRKVSNLWNANVDYYPFNFDAPTFFEKNSFNTDFFVDVNDRNASKEKILLGKKLFFDKKLSAKGDMSCATCHAPEKAYADGFTLAKGNNGKSLERNTPTLLNSIYQKAFFWDGRATTIEDQIKAVFTNKNEFNTKVHQFSGKILTDSTYVDLFQQTFGYTPKTNREIIGVISVFVANLNAMNSKFDRNIRGEENTLTEKEKLGFNLFAGKALCATCHFIPLTNGSVPPFFNETEKEVIGVPNTKNNRQLDDDKGFYWVFKENNHNGMFKTPTVRNIELTAPYMHNGVYKTLEEVVDFYNKGGGSGLGFDLPHQTLPFDNLNLTDKEQKALVAFMKTLTDTVLETEY